MSEKSPPSGGRGTSRQAYTAEAPSKRPCSWNTEYQSDEAHRAFVGLSGTGAPRLWPGQTPRSGRRRFDAWYWTVLTLSKRPPALGTCALPASLLNSGCLLFRRCDSVAELFEVWQREWRMFRGRDQLALMRAVALTGIEAGAASAPIQRLCRSRAGGEGGDDKPLPPRPVLDLGQAEPGLEPCDPDRS